LQSHKTNHIVLKDIAAHKIKSYRFEKHCSSYEKSYRIEKFAISYDKLYRFERHCSS